MFFLTLHQYYAWCEERAAVIERAIERKQFLALKEADETLEDDIEAVQEGAALLQLNREPHYLKQATVDYLREIDHESVASSVDAQEWEPYTELVLKKKDEPVLKKTQPRRRRSSVTPSKVGRQGGKLHRLHGSRHAQFPIIWPIELGQFWISSHFGPRKGKRLRWKFHYGIDMASVRGIPVKAAYQGTVIEARYNAPGFGNTVLIEHNKQYKTRYAHLDTICVRVGDKVSQGTKIGAVGDTGFTVKQGRDASHLHFELYERNKAVNPIYYLPVQRG